RIGSAGPRRRSDQWRGRLGATSREIGAPMNLREPQRPLKERYRDEPEASRITLSARGSTTDQPVTCSVDIGRGVPFDRIEVAVEGDLDLRGTPGVDRDAPVGFEAIRLRLEGDSPA